MKAARARWQQSGADKRPLIVAGVMSGTSADGIDVALVRIAPRRGGLRDVNLGPWSGPLRIEPIAHASFPYPASVRRRVLQAMNATNESVANLSRLHWRLGQLYADAVEATLQRYPVPLDLVGCHGQTIYHQGAPRRYLGSPVACTWQMGEASVLAERLKVPVVSDFRPADLAAGGQGAPLVPLLDYVLFRSVQRNRVLQNLGGIGNLTAIRANASPQDVLAFDTGPGNMVIDAIVAECFQKKYDAEGAIAARGRVLEPVVTAALQDAFFRASPPKSAGREQFGREYARRFLLQCRRLSGRAQDAVATATGLTARSIGLAWRQFVQPALAARPTDYILAGGGAKNATLRHMLELELAPFGKIRTLASADFGIQVEAKEAIAFALLAYQTWNRLPGNLPSATGAARPVILGKITHA